MKSLQIDVYSCPDLNFLGSGFAPFREFNSGEKLISNAHEINSQVEQIRKRHKKKEVCFKTTILD